MSKIIKKTHYRKGVGLEEVKETKTHIKWLLMQELMTRVEEDRIVGFKINVESALLKGRDDTMEMVGTLEYRMEGEETEVEVVTEAEEQREPSRYQSVVDGFIRSQTMARPRTAWTTDYGGWANEAEGVVTDSG